MSLHYLTNVRVTPRRCHARHSNTETMIQPGTERARATRLRQARGQRDVPQAGSINGSDSVGLSAAVVGSMGAIWENAMGEIDFRRSPPMEAVVKGVLRGMSSIGRPQAKFMVSLLAMPMVGGSVHQGHESTDGDLDRAPAPQ